MASVGVLGAGYWAATPSNTAQGATSAPPRISRYLVGNNVWMSPSAAVWDVASKAGRQQEDIRQAKANLEDYRNRKT